MLLAAALASGGGRAVAAESVEYEIAPAGDELFSEGAAPEPAPGPGLCLVVFRYSRFSAADISQITVTAPDGRALPLAVEPLFVEFGKIADARLAFTLPEAEARVGNGPFTLKWGPDVAARNAKAEKLLPDPARREAYRSLRPRPGANGPGGNVATLEVIADSSAEYHFLWYLLPMALVFVLLVVRKLCARGPVAPPP